MRVLCFGTFDLLHKGHIFFLKKASRYGNLNVVIARDETVRKIKKKIAYQNEYERKENVEKLEFVDKAYLGNKLDKYKIIEQINPSLIILGYDQKFFTENLKKELKKRSIKAEIMRINENFNEKKYKSSIIKSNMIEMELTYLAKEMPKGIEKAKKKKIVDLYIPKNSHPSLRIRQIGDKFEITKKTPLNKEDSSIQKEHTIQITQQEFESLQKSEHNKIEKIRHYIEHDGHIAQIDVFEGKHKGLILIEFEFKTQEEKENFHKPYFCLKDVTQEEFIAGGKLSTRSYEEIKEKLDELGYQKILK